MMSLSVTRRQVAASDLGAENPLPDVARIPEIPYPLDATIPDDIASRVRYGTPRTLFPYQQQSGYERALDQRELVTFVLENTRLRAVFLPELGGRLWELFDKTSGKHLLHSPASIQFANLGLRNAWFAGGIEWNVGTRGHSPLTCSPMHAGRIVLPDGRKRSGSGNSIASAK
jgi:hypothetical protein